LYLAPTMPLARARGFFPGPRFLLSFARLRLNLSPNVAAAVGKHFRSMDRGGGGLALALFPPPHRVVAEPAVQLRLGHPVPGSASSIFPCFRFFARAARDG